jgi:hypothetical protein
MSTITNFSEKESARTEKESALAEIARLKALLADRPNGQDGESS